MELENLFVESRVEVELRTKLFHFVFSILSQSSLAVQPVKSRAETTFTPTLFPLIMCHIGLISSALRLLFDDLEFALSERSP